MASARQRVQRAAPDAPVAPGNREAVDAWDGVLFERFCAYRDVVVGGLAPHGDLAMELHPPRIGARVLDVGCGFGDTTRQLAALVGSKGEAVGVDASARFIDTARAEASATGVDNVSFVVGDVQELALDGPFDHVFSRFGTMFFANPVVALRNVRAAMAPGAKLCMVVWRRKLDNTWVHDAELVAKRYLTHPDETDEPTCGPGPFSMADADTTADVLVHAGFQSIGFRRADIPIWLGPDVAAALEFVMALGPAGELVRLNGDAAEPYRKRIEAEIAEAMGSYAGPDGVLAPASSWIVTAVEPPD